MKNNIAELRKEKNITQSELAFIVGVSRQSISSLETEMYSPSLSLAYKISKYFNKNIDEIFVLNYLVITYE